jgi:hypothetical protein
MEVWKNSQFNQLVVVTYFPTSPNWIIPLTIKLYCRFFIQMSLDHNSETGGASSNRALVGGCYQGNGRNMTSVDARDEPLHELDVPGVGNKDDTLLHVLM